MSASEGKTGQRLSELTGFVFHAIMRDFPFGAAAAPGCRRIPELSAG